MYFFLNQYVYHSFVIYSIFFVCNFPSSFFFCLFFTLTHHFSNVYHLIPLLTLPPFSTQFNFRHFVFFSNYFNLKFFSTTTPYILSLLYLFSTSVNATSLSSQCLSSYILYQLQFPLSYLNIVYSLFRYIIVHPTPLFSIICYCIGSSFLLRPNHPSCKHTFKIYTPAELRSKARG